MTACRLFRRPLLPLAAVAAGVVAAWLGWAGRAAAADDNPNGRIVSEVVPVAAGKTVRPPNQIRQQMHTRAGARYEKATAEEDVRRLQATKWFAPGGVQIKTVVEPDGRVKVLVLVTELTGVVDDVQFVGAEHIRVSDLQTMTGVRRGEPMNPVANELGRVAIQRRYQEDGRYYATVDLVEGGKPTDTRVIYRIVEGPKVKVAGVDFRGPDHASVARLRAQLVTKKEFLGFFGGTFNPATLELDRQRLVDYYENLGFLDVKVDSEVERTDDLGHVRLVYYISEGRQYKVAGVQIDGAKSFPMAKLEPLVDSLKPGQRYDLRESTANKFRLEDYYGHRGHKVQAVEHRYAVPDQPDLVQVHYEVVGDRGTADRVGRLIIEGNNVTRDGVILNQLTDDFRPGQILPYNKLDEARMRLARLGIFDPENPPTVEVLPNEFDSGFKDLRVTVQEYRTGQFQFGANFNTDAGITGNFVLNERNFDLFRLPTLENIRAGRAFRGGGQEFRLEAAPGTQFQRYSATLREPFLFDTPNGLTVSGFYFNRSFAEYNEDRYGGRFTLDRRLDPIWRASVGVRTEGIKIGDVPGFATPAISDDVGNHFLLGLRPGVTRDTRDSYLYPTTGSVLDLAFEQVLGSYTFPVGTLEYTQFLSSKYLAREDGSGKHVLGLRTQVSVAGANAPVFERFYGGGIRSFRGFTFRGLGPFENGLAVGGTFAFLNSVEYQIPIDARDKFHFVVFADHGTVERRVSIRDYRVAVGAGLRLNIPALGPLPLAIDLGFPLNKGPFDKGQTFSISAGVFGGPGGGF
jgi:outer membrane protein assembly complex protein YaeT